MQTYQQIEKSINDIKEINQEAGNKLHEQMFKAQNASWSASELSDLLKSEEDVADTYFNLDSSAHSDVRNIQDAIISFYSEM